MTAVGALRTRTRAEIAVVPALRDGDDEELLPAAAGERALERNVLCGRRIGQSEPSGGAGVPALGPRPHPVVAVDEDEDVERRPAAAGFARPAGDRHPAVVEPRDLVDRSLHVRRALEPRRPDGGNK